MDHHFISCFLLFHSLSFDPTQNEWLLMGSGKGLDPVFLVWRFNVTFFHTLDTLCVHPVKPGPDEWRKGSFWSHWKQNIPELVFLFYFRIKQKNMIHELFKSHHCECICGFNCTITLMAVNTSWHWDEFILKTWLLSNDLDNGEVFVSREIKFRKGLQRKKTRIQWISQHHITSICKMVFLYKLLVTTGHHFDSLY